jgi:hypothetical protein
MYAILTCTPYPSDMLSELSVVIREAEIYKVPQRQHPKRHLARSVVVVLAHLVGIRARATITKPLVLVKESEERLYGKRVYIE